ncbi:hypothetical protein [Hymenobacter koreensis]|uniref:Type VI secretion system contractile sheath small subunit n=1 Tax=Hymenobacter koreensis TaxID=1084523 RepID=A0ABP8JJM3_9BACT
MADKKDKTPKAETPAAKAVEAPKPKRLRLDLDLSNVRVIDQSYGGGGEKRVDVVIPVPTGDEEGSGLEGLILRDIPARFLREE